MQTRPRGGRVAWNWDGGPDTWWATCGVDGFGKAAASLVTGARFCSNDYDYTITDAKTLWIHDHTIGQTRLTVWQDRVRHARHVIHRILWVDERVTLPRV